MIRKEQGGYTLIEMLIVMPIIALITGVMFSFLLDRYGSLVNETTEANLRLEAQTMLLNLEDELLFTTEYGTEVIGGTLALSDPYAPDGGWTNATSPETLIVYETALDSDRRDPNRDFVFRNQYGCSSSYNRIAINNLIYFAEDNPDDEYKTLYKRTLTPQYALCNGPNYKQQTCPEENVGTPPCEDRDAKLTEKLVDMEFDFFDEENNPTTVLSDAEKIEMLVTLGEQSYGESIEVKARFIIKKIN